MSEQLSQQLEPMNAIQYDNLELQIKKDQSEDRKGFSTPFHIAIKEWLDLAYMLPKDRKENFIVKEKLTSNLYKIIRKEKRFKNPENIFGEIQYFAVFDKETKEIGKVMNINLQTKEVEFLTYFDKMNGYDTRTKHFRDIYLFDYNSSQLEVMFKDYSAHNKMGLSFSEMVHFLDQPDYIAKKEIKYEKGYGVELVSASDHPIMKQVMLEYKIPEEVVKKPKKKLYQMDATSMDIICEFESIKEAAEKTGISSSTIHNVLCSGFSAIKYLLAGGCKWKYSNEDNKKYFWSAKLGKKYSALTREQWNDIVSNVIKEEDNFII